MSKLDNRITHGAAAHETMPNTGHPPVQPEQSLLTEAAAAKRLGVSPQYLVKWRFLGRPVLPFVRIGKRMIRYRLADLDAYIENRVVPPAALQPRYDAVAPRRRG